MSSLTSRMSAADATCIDAKFKDDDVKYSRALILTFLLTYIGYASVYFVRKPFSVVKHDLKESFNLSAGTLATVDSAFMLCYAVSSLTVGTVVERLGVRQGLVTAFVGAAIATASFAATDSALFWLLSWSANGIFQAWGYPMCLGLLAPLVSAEARGRVFGLWNTCSQIGGMTANFIAGVANKQAGWRFAFVLPSLWLGFMAVLVFLFMPHVEGSAAKQKTSTRNGSMRTALSIPSIKEVGVSYFCLKLVRYIGILWVPYFLTEIGFEAEVAAVLACAFDLGGVLGGLVCGSIADLLGGKLLFVCSAMCGTSAILLFIYANVYASLGWIGHAVMLSTIGLFVAGPDSNFVGAALVGVVQRAGQSDALPSASGFVNGMGSLGAVFCGPLVASITGSGNWRNLWLTLSFLCTLPCLILISSVLDERRMVKRY